MGKFNLDIFADVAFQMQPDGTRVFFPYGALTRGRVVDSDEIYRRVFFVHKWWSISILTVCMFMGAVEIPWEEQLPVVLVCNLLQFFFTRRVTRTLPVSNVRFDMKDMHRNFPKIPTLSPLAVVCLAIVSMVSLAMGLTVFALSPDVWPTGLLYIGISAAIVYFCVRNVKSKAA